LPGRVAAPWTGQARVGGVNRSGGCSVFIRHNDPQPL
jgi:hypothetical protein